MIYIQSLDRKHYGIFLTDADGAATTLAFIGTVGTGKIVLEAKLSLASFVLGLIFAGIVNAKTVHQMYGLFEHYKSLVADYFTDKISCEEAIQKDKEKSVEDSWDYFFPYASFGCFVIGSIIGFYALI